MVMTLFLLQAVFPTTCTGPLLCVRKLLHFHICEAKQNFQMHSYLVELAAD
jgi:hypothetical protein